MAFPLFWKGMGVCKSRFGSSTRLGDQSINKQRRSTTVNKLEARKIYTVRDTDTYCSLMYILLL